MTDVSELGRFWLPCDPEDFVEGTLIVDENGVTLVTQGQLLVSGLRNRKPRTIHGVLATDHVKLVDALITQSDTSSGRFLPERNQETWYCSGAFRGGQYDGDWPDNITSVEFQVQSLEDWVQGFAGLKWESGNSAGYVSWLRDPPDLTHQWELGEVSIRQTVGDSWQAARHHVREVTVRTNTFFHIDFDRPQSWEATLGVVGSLQALVSIATGKQAAVEWTAIVEGPTDVRLIAYYVPTLRVIGQPVQHHELFTMDELGGIAGVGEWLNLMHDQGILRSALLVDRYRHPPFITDPTGHLLIACEVYRRPSMGNPRAQVELRKDILDPMLCRAGQGFLDWIGDSSAWTRQVSEIRNKHGIAHFQAFNDEPVDVLQVHTLNQQLYVLVVNCVLADCGVSGKLKDEVVARFRSEMGRLLL